MDVLTCTVHSNQPVRWTCCVCAMALCGKCGAVEYGGNIYCPSCSAKISADEDSSPIEPAGFLRLWLVFFALFFMAVGGIRFFIPENFPFPMELFHRGMGVLLGLDGLFLLFRLEAARKILLFLYPLDASVRLVYQCIHQSRKWVQQYPNLDPTLLQIGGITFHVAIYGLGTLLVLFIFTRPKVVQQFR